MTKSLLYQPAHCPACDHAPAPLISSKPSWANFTMEIFFWDCLTNICAIEDMAPIDFVMISKRKHPKRSTAASVRLEIATYYATDGTTPLDIVSVGLQQLYQMWLGERGSASSPSIEMHTKFLQSPIIRLDMNRTIVMSISSTQGRCDFLRIGENIHKFLPDLQVGKPFDDSQLLYRRVEPTKWPHKSGCTGQVNCERGALEYHGNRIYFESIFLPYKDLDETVKIVHTIFNVDNILKKLNIEESICSTRNALFSPPRLSLPEQPDRFADGGCQNI